MPMTDGMVYTGRVVGRIVNRGSKSEYQAPFLETSGGVLRLWRPAGPAFHDPVLWRLVGSMVRCRGHVEGGKLILSSWRKIKPTLT
jgi:hypothetical protein